VNVTGNQLGVRNIRFEIEYDGTDFCGWQKQPKVRTVEGEIIKALSGLLGSEPEIIAAGRTDSGVHALGQVVNFSCISSMPAGEIMNGANALLPPDVRITGSAEVPLAFNARFDARKRSYRYELTRRPTSLWRRHKWFVKYQLDVEAINKAIAAAVGDHDFTAFTTKDEDRSPIINVMEASVTEAGSGGLDINLSANRFLRRMVRMLAGTLVEVGRGKLEPGEFCDILATRDRDGAGPCAPPHGLYLVRVEY
jgi:tRNA pseudouridine38-40 synthase